MLLSFRANIDEVETEVVEIEAKLDKVRRLLLSLPDAIYLSGSSSGPEAECFCAVSVKRQI